MAREPRSPPLGDGTRRAPRLLVEAWVVRRTGESWRVLLLQRTRSGGGFWQGISGKVEPDDLSLEAAARREITEEIGWTARDLRLHPLPPEQTFEGLDGVWYRKRSFVAIAPASPEIVQLSDEHARQAWLPIDAARERVEIPAYREELARLQASLEALKEPGSGRP